MVKEAVRHFWRCSDLDIDGTRCGALKYHEGRHSWHPSCEDVWVLVTGLTIFSVASVLMILIIAWSVLDNV